MTTSVAIQIEAPRVVVRPRQAPKTGTIKTQTEQEVEMEEDPVFDADESLGVEVVSESYCMYRADRR